MHSDRGRPARASFHSGVFAAGGSSSGASRAVAGLPALRCAGGRTSQREQPASGRAAHSFGACTLAGSSSGMQSGDMVRGQRSMSAATTRGNHYQRPGAPAGACTWPAAVAAIAGPGAAALPEASSSSPRGDVRARAQPVALPWSAVQPALADSLRSVWQLPLLAGFHAHAAGPQGLAEGVRLSILCGGSSSSAGGGLGVGVGRAVRATLRMLGK